MNGVGAMTHLCLTPVLTVQCSDSLPLLLKTVTYIWTYGHEKYQYSDECLRPHSIDSHP